MNVREKLKPFFIEKNGDYKNEISDEVLDFIFKEKLFKSFLPKELNGLSYSIHETLELIKECSYVNGSLGWLIQIGNGGNYFASNFIKEQSIKLFSPEKAVIAGSGAINGTVEKAENGWIVNGKWSYCSGAAYATLFTFCIEIAGESWAVIAPKEQVIIHNDWNTFGMKATSTNTIEIKNQLIKKEQLFKVDRQLSFNDYPIFSLPFLIYAQAFFIHNLYGMLERMANESYDEIVKNETLTLLDKLQSEHLEIITSVEEKSELNQNEEEAYMIKYKKQAQLIQDQSLKLFSKSGIHGVYESNITGTFFRDILTVCQHKLLSKKD